MPPETRLTGSPGQGSLAALAIAVLMLSASFPPEIHPASRAMVAVLLALALPLLVRSLLGGGRRRQRTSIPLLLPFAAIAIALAPCRARAVDQAAALALLGVAFALGTALHDRPEPRRHLSLALIVMGALVSAQAVLQHHVLYRLQAEALATDAFGATDALLFRLRAGRPAGPFSLPAALGGFLALSLPVTLAACRPQRGRIRLVAAAAALLQGYALLLTQSFGALLATAAAIVIVLPLLVWDRRLRRRAGLALLALLILCAGGLLAARRGEFTDDPGGGPLAMRAGNWSAAARMIASHPLFGIGPGSYGVAYTRFIREGMNETRYAHNSYLQAAAGWGIWILLPLWLFVGGRIRDVATARRSPDERLALLGGGAAFLLHNMVDFTAYLPGIAIPAVLLLGAGRPGREGDATNGAAEDRCAGPGDPAGLRTTRRALLSVAGLVGALLLAGHETAAARVDHLLDRAAAQAAAGEIDGAAATARQAASLRRHDPLPRAFLAQLVLRDGMADDRLRIEGTRASRDALRLDPEAAILHYTAAGYAGAAGATSEAYREIEAAHRLYPIKPLYRDALARRAAENP